MNSDSKSYVKYPTTRITYDENGSVIHVEGMTYEQQMEFRRQLNAQRRAYIEKRLRENFPLLTAFATLIFLLLSGIGSIIIQIWLMAESTPYSSSASGIIGGTFALASALTIFLLIIKRNYGTYLACIITTSIGISMGLTFQLTYNINALTQYKECLPTYCPMKFDYRTLCIISMVLGGISSIACLVIVISLSVSMCNCSNAQNTNEISPDANNPYSQNYNNNFNSNI